MSSVVFVCLMFGGSMPILYFIGMFATAITYFTDRLTLTYFYRLPPKFTEKLNIKYEGRLLDDTLRPGQKGDFENGEEDGLLAPGVWHVTCIPQDHLSLVPFPNIQAPFNSLSWAGCRCRSTSWTRPRPRREERHTEPGRPTGVTEKKPRPPRE